LARISTVIFVLFLAACSREPVETQQGADTPGFVGSDQCASCHQVEFDQWQPSHHNLAMQVATEQTVLGDFNETVVPYFDAGAIFSRRDGRFFVSTENAAGEPQEFEITHTFGVAPLQQYLVDAPRGRKQALQFAWDSRPDEDGGQRWYHLYADENIVPDDPLHWTGRYFNWNYMCAECHSTNLELGYDIDSDSFNTTYSEISVGCEACHGPGSIHIDQASAGAFDEAWGLSVSLNERVGAAWVMNSETGIAERNVPNIAQQQPESCGRCHSRRSVVATEYEYGAPLTETHRLSLLDENLYHADGRIMDEVYVYGSFVQSRMYAAGVTCSDCHNPHSAKLRAGPDPNDTCATCHLTTKFATADHAAEQVGDCVSCHMPATTYMGVDDRRDHSFRIPGTINDDAHYGAPITAGRTGSANAELLRGIANAQFPPIARATMLTLLDPIADAEGQAVLLDQLDDPDPLLRIGALFALRQQAPELGLARGSHLLRDAVRSVRLEAALTYVDYRDLLPLEDARAFARAADDFRNAMRAASSNPQPALNLAEFETRIGDLAAAARMYEHAIRVGPDSAPARHAYGLYLVRSGRSSEALGHLQRASELAPEVAQFVYAYGVALNSLGQPDMALRVLSGARQGFPDDFNIGWALATMFRDAGDRESALSLLGELGAQFPGDPRVNALAEALAE